MCSGRKAGSRKENLITAEPDAWAWSQAFCQLPKQRVLDRQMSASDQTDEPTNHPRALKLLSCQKSLQGLWWLILLTNLTASRFIYSPSSTHSPKEFFLIRLFEAGRPTLNLDHAFWQYSMERRLAFTSLPSFSPWDYPDCILPASQCNKSAFNIN